jgi:hypothetical protein|eukprot:2634811-Prymnesium_polylepis.1
MVVLVGLGAIAWVGDQNLGTKAWSSVTSSVDGTVLTAVVNGGNIWHSSSSGASWSEVSPSGTTLSWAAVASSSDGTRQVAVEDGPGGIWTSSDSGATWSSTSAQASAWAAIASSTDGASLVAVVNGGKLWRSSDYGQNCAQRNDSNSQLPDP